MIRFVIPKKYNELFKNKEIEKVSLKIDDVSYEFSPVIQVFDKRSFDSIEDLEMAINSPFPSSWIETYEIIQPVDIVTPIVEEIVNAKNNSLFVLKTRIKGPYFFFKDRKGNILEVNGECSRGRPNIRARIDVLLLNGIDDFKEINIDYLEEVSPYFNHLKNWEKKDNSSGGGNLTKLLSETEVSLLKVQYPERNYIKQEFTSYRIIKGKEIV